MRIARLRASVAAALAAATVFAAACGKPEAPKVDAAAEQAAARKRAAEGPFGTQVNAVDEAKKLQSDFNAKATEGVDRIEKEAK